MPPAPPVRRETGHAPWWKGSRGEWLVAAQFALISLVFLGPRTIAGRPAWQFPFPQLSAAAGILFIGIGAALLTSGAARLGHGLTPLPYPKDNARLVQTGPYSLVRHPIYSGGITITLGWSLYVHGWLTLAYVAALFLFFDAKSRREEKWLSEKFPEYPAYRERVHKLIPFVY